MLTATAEPPAPAARPEARPAPAGRTQTLFDSVVLLTCLLAGLAVGTFRLESSGALWPDSMRYTNASAMMHDWLRSGEYARPVAFAQKNYAQYPAFNVPFHPPVYPGLVGVTFLSTGVSYEAARLFVALSFGLAAFLLYAVCRELGTRPVAAALAAAVFLTTPAVAQWARDTMSEVPSLAVLFAAAWAFLRYAHTGRGVWLVPAFVLLEAAFLCRVTTAGVLPGWAAYLVLCGRFRWRDAWKPALAAAAYLALNLSWLMFVRRFSALDMGADGKGELPTWANLLYFRSCGAELFLVGATLPALAGAALWLRSRAGGPLPAAALGLFWACWFDSYLAFKLAVPTTPESRHFLTALPALAGLAAVSWELRPAAGWGRWAVAAVAAAGLALGVAGVAQTRDGVVGYRAVARDLAAQSAPGNILLAIPEEQDLIFHYRCCDDAPPRRMVRGDRTLALRLAPHTKVGATQLAHTADDVVEVVKKARARFVVTYACADPKRCTEEGVLAHKTAGERPDLFRRVSRRHVRCDYVHPVRPFALEVSVWEYLGDLPDGPSDIPVTIPTAGMTYAAGE